MPKNNLDAEFWIFIGILAIPIILVFFVGMCMFINEFSRELKFLNNEIRRTKGAERRHYIHQKRRLWLSLIPFVKY